MRARPLNPCSRAQQRHRHLPPHCRSPVNSYTRELPTLALPSRALALIDAGGEGGWLGIAGATRSIDHSSEWSEGSTERYADRDAHWQANGSNASQPANEQDGKYVSVSQLVEEGRRVAADGMFREVLKASLQEMLQLDRDESIYTEERTVGARTVVRRNGPAPALVEEKIQTSGRYLPVVQVRLGVLFVAKRTSPTSTP